MNEMLGITKKGAMFYVFSLAAIFWIFINCYLAFITFWPNNLFPLKTIDFPEPMKILNTDKIYPGDDIHYQLKYNKHATKPAMISRMVINDRIFVFSDFQSNIKQGPGTLKTQIHLPITAIPGPHIVRWVVCYEDVIPFKKICKTVDSETFTVYKR
jgi:hypothetical protein